MMKIQSGFLIPVILIGLMAGIGGRPAYGQSATSQNTTELAWVNLGLGLGYSNYQDYLSTGASISYQFGKSLVSIRYVSNAEFDLLGPEPDESVWDAGVLYGRIAKASYGLASISAGISRVGGVYRGNYLGSEGWFSSRYEKLTFRTVGIPVEGQLFWTPTPIFGLGIYGYANLNRERSFQGVLFCIQIGKLR